MTGGPTGPRRLLLVDDEQGMRDTLVDILEELDLRVDQAANGQEAVDKIKAHEYGLVLMDIRMPLLDGVGALRQIKELCPGLPVIMMTAYTEAAEVEEALRQGARAVMYKPLDIPSLLDLIELSLVPALQGE